MHWPIPVLAATLLACALLPGLPRADDSPRLQLGETVYAGGLSGDGEIAHFFGVPFAAAPVGENRWRPPRPLAMGADAVEVVVDATRFAAACYQGPHMFDWYRDVIRSFGGDPAVFSAPPVSEDCLYLNVWTPRRQSPTARPVMVYVHGGSNKGGWSYEPNYLGENLARQQVVVISVAYRLGVFGFFSHPALAQSNFGLLDLVAALEWVNRNAAALGGDPGNVTLFGESSGASNIAWLLAVPAAQGLFHRVIHQSAGWAMDARDTRQRQMPMGLALQSRLVGDQGNIDNMRAVSADRVLTAAEQVYDAYDFDPVVDGDSVSETLTAALSATTAPPVDILVGTNADEWLMYLEPQQSPAQWLGKNVTGELIEEVKAAVGDDLDAAHALDRLITADTFVCPSMRLAQALRRRGGRAWFYLFARTREGARAEAVGAYHGAELPYVFATHDDWLPTDAVDLRLTTQVMNAWVSFARTGAPGPVAEVAWPPFDLELHKTMVLDARPAALAHRDRELCRVLDSRP